MDRALWLAAGLALGFVAGSRIGREPYEQAVDGARRMWENPRVQDAAHVLQAQAARMYDEGIKRLTPDGATPSESRVVSSPVGS